LDRRDAPEEDEQYATYLGVAQALEGRSLSIRTLDIGGDKPLPYVNAPREVNPFLGLRGLRFSLAHPELLKTQLRAILRVAESHPIRVMFPMVSTVREFRAALEFLQQARVQLAARGITPPRIEAGIMVEVPGAALLASSFAREVDFFSIGTNDLTQYTLAAERGNPNVAALADEMSPAVLRLISGVVQAAHSQNKWVGVCGELGGDPSAIPVLVGLGVDELSMSAPLIPGAKQIARDLTLADAHAAANRALEPSTP
jgi:phosphocarrier protein FPr